MTVDRRAWNLLLGLSESGACRSTRARPKSYALALKRTLEGIDTVDRCDYDWSPNEAK